MAINDPDEYCGCPQCAIVRAEAAQLDGLMIDRLGDMTERCYRAEGVARTFLELLRYQKYEYGLNTVSTQGMDLVVAENQWLEETA